MIISYPKAGSCKALDKKQQQNYNSLGTETLIKDQRMDLEIPLCATILVRLQFTRTVLVIARGKDLAH